MINLGASVIFTNLKIIPLQQDIFRFEISVSVANAMDEGKWVEDLVEELFDDFAWKAFVLVFFNNLIQWTTELFKHNTKVAPVVKGLNKLDNSIIVLWICFVDGLDDVPFSFGRVHVLFDGFDDLD